MDILDDMGVSNLSAKVFFKANYSFKEQEFRKEMVSRFPISTHTKQVGDFVPP